ncbi:uncharacterized protein [Primulina eburnea]|uniref:uncharacterized protein n=1 Tax=Primulina eburnea TaxID=1245227 RepID=UPI003C6CAB06
MDKSWIPSDRRSKQYEEGVELFIRSCLENPHIDPNLIHCPCCKCKNLKKIPAKSIREHLYFHGFIQNYVNWIWHGESAESDKVNWSTNKEPIGNYHGHFEATNMCEAAYDNYTENPELFTEFLEEAEKPLYNGCKRYTKLSAIVKLYNTKAKHGMSDALFSDLLMDFGDMIPDNHNLPTKMYDVKKTLGCLTLSHEKINACSNDFILYRKQYKDCVNCPKCGLSRWKLTKKNVEKKGVPAKPGNDIDVYLDVLVEDLQRLWDVVDGVYDAYRRQFFPLKAVLLWTINDFLAYGNLSGCTTHGYYACPLSDIRCVFGKKTIVKGKKRKNAKDNNLEDSKEEKDFGSTDFRKCLKKKSIFFNLPYWKHLHVRHCLDVMHIEKNVFESLINTLMNVKGKTKDNVAARLDMVQMGVRP